MTCDNCREDLAENGDRIALRSRDWNLDFCSVRCLRRFLGPDQPLTERIARSGSNGGEHR